MSDIDLITEQIRALMEGQQIYDYYFAFKDPDSHRVRMCKTTGLEWVHGSLTEFKMITKAEMKVSIRKATGMEP